MSKESIHRREGARGFVWMRRCLSSGIQDFMAPHMFQIACPTVAATTLPVNFDGGTGRLTSAVVAARRSKGLWCCSATCCPSLGSFELFRPRLGCLPA